MRWANFLEEAPLQKQEKQKRELAGCGIVVVLLKKIYKNSIKTTKNDTKRIKNDIKRTKTGTA